MEPLKLSIFEWACGIAVLIFAFGIPGIIQEDMIVAILLILLYLHTGDLRRFERLENIVEKEIAKGGK